MSSQTLGGKDACATEKILEKKPINSAQWAQLVSCSKVKKKKKKKTFSRVFHPNFLFDNFSREIKVVNS